MQKHKRVNASHLEFPYALKSFLGYLEGTEKSEHTIKNYRLDILAFENFIQTRLSDRPVRLDRITTEDVERFHNYLKDQGLKTNTRRRKLLTVRKFLSFHVQRNLLPVELGRKMPTPHKIERVPATVSSAVLLTAIRALPMTSILDRRNRLILWTLAETGAQVGEVSRLRFQDWTPGRVRVSGPGGKGARELNVSKELSDAALELAQEQGGAKANKPTVWVFQGFNKFGSLGGAISARGVELLVKHYAPKLGVGDLTPRTFRHSAVLRWFAEGMTRGQIQERLGLKTAYAFRIYDLMIKASTALPAKASG